tara:strand:- start:1036 stop:1872 length:837 start_codon:yes stop_codon:yes gene_type:complete
MPSSNYINSRVQKVGARMRKIKIKNSYKNVNILEDALNGERVIQNTYCDVTRFKEVTNCSGITRNQYCTGNFRKPLPGYRKESNCIDAPGACPKMQEVYKDPHSLAMKKDGTGVCYDKRIRSINNKNGKKNLDYCYDYAQYLRKKCKSFKQNSKVFVRQDGAGNDFFASDCCVGDDGCNKISFKQNNKKFSSNSAVSSSSRLTRLKYDAISGSKCKDGKKCQPYNSFNRYNVNVNQCNGINSVGCAGSKVINAGTSNEKKTSWKTKRMRIGGVMRKAR